VKIPKELQGTREHAQRLAQKREERDRAEQARLAALPPKLTTLQELLDAVKANPNRIVLHATERGHGIIDRARKEFVVQPPGEGKRWVAALAEMGVEGYEPSVERS
jgi:DNA-binding protein H-NS